jgi:excisionase family DNA binding protein
MSEPTRWHSLKSAAAYCQCSTVTLGREARLGRLRGYKLARRRAWRFAVEDLDAWMKSSAEPALFVPKHSRVTPLSRASAR